MKRKINVKNLIKSIILLSIISFGFFALIFPLAKYKLPDVYSKNEVLISGYTVLNNPPKILGKIKSLSVGFSIIYITLSATLLIFTIIRIVDKNAKEYLTPTKIIALCVILSILYAVNGYLVVEKIKDYYNFGIQIKISTLSFIPCIINVGLGGIYYILDKFLPEK